ncbi:hypothetical protein NSA19_07495 [Actinomyces bowdenii]|uniref:DUF6571 family protein n=1 Tax=Actinomyces bowdenii TaxID=131109 RepID=UPI00214C9E70|nr:DUF6571 family protein [Actinomyces bowdenii]MCR2052692.1 hypothetical protein [Actinomyces bowdenii]
MTYVSLNPEKMMALINNLVDRAHCIGDERRNIHRASEDNSHHGTPPVPSVDGLSDYTSQNAGTTTLHGAVDALITVAGELDARRTEVVNLNSDGVTIRNPDGTLSYYLPSPSEGVDPASVDTIENVRAYNSEAAAIAKAEAAELKEAVESGQGKSSKGRTVDEILEEIQKHQDIPTYGASFANAVGGAQAYLDMVEVLERDCTDDQLENAVDTLGHVLGAASHDAVGGARRGQEFGSIIEKTPSDDNVVRFNALVDRPEAVYGTQFLVTAADHLEEIDPKVVGYGSSSLSKNYSLDPLAGVLNAMGRNPEASLIYLGGEGSVDAEGNWVPDKATEERWNKLKSRSWDYHPLDSGSTQHTAADGLTAALAAVSAYRNPDPSEPEKRPGADAAATYATAMGIDYFGGESWSKKDFSETMKQNMSVVLANSPEEVAATASGAELAATDAGPSLKKWGVEKEDISTLIYRFGDSESAMATLSAGLGDHHHKQYEMAMAGSPDPGAELMNQQQLRSATLNYIQNLSQQRLEDNDVESNARTDNAKTQNEQTANTIISVFNTTAAAGISAVSGGAGAPLAYGLASTITQPLAADALASMLPVPPADSDASSNSDTSSRDYYRRLQAQAYADAIELELSQEGSQGIIDDEALKDLENHDWYDPDPEHGRPHVDPSRMTTEQIESMASWRNKYGGSSSILQGLDNATSTGTTGAESVTGPPEAKKPNPKEDEQENEEKNRSKQGQYPAHRE